MENPTYTKLLIHFDGADNATTHTAASGQVVTFAGNAIIDTAQSKFGGSSLYLDGAAGTWVTVPDSDDWALGSGNWTVDFWVRWGPAATNNGWFFGQYIDGNNRWGGVMEVNHYYAPYIVDGAVTKAQYDKAWSPSDETWYHIAVVRNGDDALYFIDGVENNPTATTAYPAGYSQPNLADVFSIGGEAGGASGRITGWIDEFRLVKGQAVWTSNFTPPTSAYEWPSGSFMPLL
jgi:hypothetical protein